MINFLCGEVVEVAEGSLVIKCGNIGYELFVSSSTINFVGTVGNSIQLFTYLQVKEDGLTLYGFATREEKMMFVRLISVSGIGCKMAISILTGCDLRQLASSILTGDTASLSSIKGVGKKTAERIILELKEKVSDIDISDIKQMQPNSPQDEAMTVLLSLGLNKSEAMSRINLAIEHDGKTAEEILSLALRNKW